MNMIRRSADQAPSLWTVQRDYLIRILQSIEGRKVMVMDQPAKNLVSQVLTQSELLEYEVYLVEDIEKLGQGKDLDSMKTILLVSPTSENIQIIINELEGYSLTNCHIYFTEPCDDKLIEQLANKDAQADKIVSVQEINANYSIVHRKAFVLHELKQNELPNLEVLCDEFSMKTRLLGLLHSLRAFPTILYSTGSVKCQSLAQLLAMEYEGSSKSTKEQLTRSDSCLLIVDRNKDKMSPLRLPWRYLSMIHEHFAYQAGRVKYGITNKEANLTEAHDKFFRDNIFENFGKTIEKSSAFLKTTAAEQKGHTESLKSLAGMEYVAEKLPDIIKKSNLAQKHWEIIELLAESSKKSRLLDQCGVEVEIMDSKLGTHTFDNVRNLVLSAEVSIKDKVRLVMMYLLRYHDDAHKTKILINDLEGFRVPKQQLEIIKTVCHTAKPAKEEKGRMDLFFSSMMSLLDENRKHLETLVNDLSKAKVEPKNLTFATSNAATSVTSSPVANRLRKPGLLIIFVVGGISLEETIELQGMKDIDFDIVAGGTHLLNTSIFMNQIFGEVLYPTGV